MSSEVIRFRGFWRDLEDRVLLNLETDPRYVREMHAGLMNEPFLRKAAARQPGILEHLPDKWRVEAVCLIAVAKDRSMLKHAPISALTPLFFSAVTIDERLFSELPAEVKTEAVWLAAGKRNAKLVEQIEDEALFVRVCTALGLPNDREEVKPSESVLQAA